VFKVSSEYPIFHIAGDKMTQLEQIIKAHEKLVYKIASKFYNVPQEDLYQAGVIGIMKAYKNFINDGTSKFTTYAYNYIFGEMYELSNSLRSIKLNKNILSIYKKIEQARYTLAQKENHLPSLEELATFLQIDIKTIQEILTLTSKMVELDAQEERPIYETIEDKNVKSPDLEIDIKDSLQTLTPAEKDIIDYRYYKDYTQTETAQALGLSQVTVSRYEKKSLKKMYNYLHT